MSTALQRLLARPSSLILLRYFVRAPIIEEALQKSTSLQCTRPRRIQSRANTTAIASALGAQESSSGEADTKTSRRHLPPLKYKDRKSSAPPISQTEIPQFMALESKNPEVFWEERLQSPDDLEFESNVGGGACGRQRLVDSPEFGSDAALWAHLLTVRKRRYGTRGVEMFWKVIRERKLHLPTEGPHAQTLWTAFLDLGLTNRIVLKQICDYAGNLRESAGRSWGKFYVYIMQHIILQDGREVVAQWHQRLIRHHAPSPAAFAGLIRNVIWMKGDLKSLKLLYERHDHRKLYAKIVPALLELDDFHGAFHWHFTLLRHGDFPLSQKAVEPLISHFTVYDPPKARRLIGSLVDAGVPFVDTLSESRGQTAEISREMMNLIHGAAFNIKPKEYSDGLGSRWFATGWVSLDFAINTVHALGVEEIGPLSLQAIALRENGVKGVMQRLNQLADLGISIGNSTFSKALESFARNEEAEFLEGLLTSDQHPDELEDPKLQESLLEFYARAGDWAQHRRTEAILLIRSGSSQTKHKNTNIRRYVSLRNHPAALQTIEEMRIEGATITQETIRWILRRVLEDRHPGHNLNSHLQNVENVRTAISIMTSIVKSQGSVPVTSWQEILRRLGKLGRLDDVEELCLWLAAWYMPKSKIRADSLPTSSHLRSSQLVPAQVPLRHPLHPLRQLFSDSLQGAIVEWGFKNSPLTQRTSSPETEIPASICDVRIYGWTRGLRLLRRLHEEGIFIKESAVRRALMNRMTILYGSGESNDLRNRHLRIQNELSLDDMVQKVNEAWGGEIFTGTAETQSAISSRLRSSNNKKPSTSRTKTKLELDLRI